MWKVSAAAVAAGLVGCASTFDPVLQSRLTGATPNQPVMCGTCTTEWQRAQIWIAQHSKWRLATSTEVTLVTFAPVGHDPSYGFQVLRVPRTAGGYQIVLSLECGNALGCDPNEEHIRRAFYHYIATGQDVLVGMGYMGSIR